LVSSHPEILFIFSIAEVGSGQHQAVQFEKDLLGSLEQLPTVATTQANIASNFVKFCEQVDHSFRALPVVAAVPSTITLAPLIKFIRGRAFTFLLKSPV
jgi:hypothetical protein